MATSAENRVEAPDAWTRIGARHDVYCEVLDFITDEARLLDEDHYDKWLEMVTDDVEYELPQRSILFRKDVGKSKELTAFFFDNWQMLNLRVRRQIDTRHALDRDPTPRIRRFITGISVWQNDNSPSEYRVTSNVQALWQRFERDGQISLSAQREDILRRTDAGLRLAKRRVNIDNAVFDARFFNVIV